MKGINASRIAAAALGVGLLGSSALAAGVMYENQELVNPNGVPTAKVVVGSNAAISDGIAAANIAATIANMAYKSSTLSASVSGTATCGAGTGTGAGSCEVSNEKVTIEITLPGTIGGAHQFKTLITDSLDKSVANRVSTDDSDRYANYLNSSDTSTIVSPLRGVAQSAGSVLYRIGENEFRGFEKTQVRDVQASSDFSYTEEQSFWVGTGSPSTGVYYDSGSDYRQIVAKPNNLVYSARFSGNDFGVPVCTNPTTSGLWADVNCSTTDKTENHRLPIKFLGEDWVISKMTAPTMSSSVGAQTVNNTVNAINGGKIKLAKEAKYDIINVGGTIDGGTFKIRLADISVATGSNNDHPAIIDVLDANDAVIGQIKVTEGETYTFTQYSTGQQIMVHVYKTAPGFTLNAKWAEIAIYTDEITLEDGKRYNNVDSNDKNWKNVVASLLWKNRDGSSSDGQADSLREVILYVDDVSSYMGNENRMREGDSVAFPKAESRFRLTYNGLDLTDADRVQLRLSSDRRDLGVGNTNDCNTRNATYTGSFIKVSTDQDGGFGGVTDALTSSGASGERVQEFYIDPTGNFSYGLGDTTQSVTPIWNYPDIFWKPSGCQYYRVSSPSGGQATGAANTTGLGITPLSAFGSTIPAVKFGAAGDTSSLAYGAIRYVFTPGNASLANNGYPSGTTMTGIVGEILLQEDAGKLNGTSDYPVTTRFPVYNISSSSEWQFKSQSSSTAVTYYNGVNLADSGRSTSTFVYSNATAYELPLVSERGSKVTDISLSTVQAWVAKKIGMPQFTFASAGNNLSSSSDDWIAQVGDRKDLTGGISLLVKDISQTVGACVAGGAGSAPACTPNMAGVTAKIMPDNVASVEVSQPVDIRGTSLVMTDKEAGSMGGTIITVGGPAVNTVTADVLKDANVDFQTTSVLVKSYGSKIVVAGYTAADTMTAANNFINAIVKS